ncbi:hypothetical protein HPB51_004656 [Rhipicephalus microplus]|uniref:THAP-type domain-containing protein n=1 Tax=Rhipicephalus microplus TaxID=6941 RepID=A0A9J6EFC0_RHIMP|nr:hypothetical protein HPB51_004656 [Rhipicephalus microplus]
MGSYRSSSPLLCWACSGLSVSPPAAYVSVRRLLLLLRRDQPPPNTAIRPMTVTQVTSMSETVDNHRQTTDKPEGCSGVTQPATSSEGAQVHGLMLQEPRVCLADGGESSASSRGSVMKMEVEVTGDVFEREGERELPGANETVGWSAEDAFEGTAEKNARRECGKVEKPLSKRMATARLIAPSRRSRRIAMAGTSSGRPEVEEAPLIEKKVEKFGGRANDKNLCMVPGVKRKGSLYKCCVSGCRASGRETFNGIWLFSLPAEEALESSWREKLPIDPEINRPRCPRVCFQHFRDEDFIVIKRRPRGVAEDAVPMLMRNEYFWHL